MKVYYGDVNTKYYKNKTLLPQLSANESEYGTASVTGQHTGQAYMFTTVGDGDLFSILNTTMVFTFDFNPEHYIPEGTVCHFDVLFGNTYADTSYCGTGVKIVATYTDDTTSILYDNNAMVTLDYSGEFLPASADCSPTLGVVKSISVTPYSTAKQHSLGKYYVARDFRMNTVVEGTADDYDYKEENQSYGLVKKDTTTYYKYVDRDFVKPILTESGVLGEDHFAVSNSITPSITYKWFDGDYSTVKSTASKTSNPQWITIYNPNPLKVTALTFYQYTKEKYYYITSLTIQACDDNSSWVDLQSWSRSSWVENFTVDLSSNTEFYKYYRVYITGRKYFDSNNAYITLMEIDITAKEKIEVISTSDDYDYTEVETKYYIYGGRK